MADLVEQAQQLAERATPGPWTHRKGMTIIGPKDGRAVATVEEWDDFDQRKADAEFIAWCRSGVSALAALVVQHLADAAAELNRSNCEQANRAEKRADGLRRECDALRADNTALRQRIADLQELFNGGPDTTCGTVWQDGTECVSVPIADLAAALKERGQ